MCIQADILGLCSYLSSTDGGTVQLLGTTLQCVPALPGAQEFCYSTAATVGDKHCSYIDELSQYYTCYNNVFSFFRWCGSPAAAVTKALKGKIQTVRYVLAFVFLNSNSLIKKIS